jgi:UDP-glucose 4-epimerase
MTGTSVERTLAGIRVLVTGGTGFLGRWLVRTLEAHGAELYVAARDEAAARKLFAQRGRAVNVIGADLAQPGAIGALIERVDPDLVFNLAVHGVDPTERDAQLMLALNASLPIELCGRLADRAGSRWAGVRFVQIGSAAEYGEVGGPIREDVPARPTTEYGRTKLMATETIGQLSRASGLRSIVVRLFTVYGPGEHEGRLLPSLEQVARSGQRLPLTSGQQRRDFTYVEDVTAGLMKLAVSASRPGMVVNLATGRLTSVRAFAETAAAVMGFDRSLLEFGALPTRVEEMHHDEVDVSRLEELTGWRPPTGVADGIRRSWEHADGR